MTLVWGGGGGCLQHGPWARLARKLMRLTTEQLHVCLFVEHAANCVTPSAVCHFCTITRLYFLPFTSTTHRLAFSCLFLLLSSAEQFSSDQLLLIIHHRI